MGIDTPMGEGSMTGSVHTDTGFSSPGMEGEHNTGMSTDGNMNTGMTGNFETSPGVTSESHGTA
jgi:hypothetical protein